VSADIYEQKLNDLIVDDETSAQAKVMTRDVKERKSKLANFKSAQVPDLRYDEDALTFIQAQGRSIRDPMENHRRAIIKGESNIDAIWSTYTNEIITYGANKYAKFAEEAYSSFQDWLAQNSGE